MTATRPVVVYVRRDRRGSAARYRRAVRAFVERMEEIVARLSKHRRRDPGEPCAYFDALRTYHEVDSGRVVAWHRRAARRARKILRRLEGRAR